MTGERLRIAEVSHELLHPDLTPYLSVCVFHDEPLNRDLTCDMCAERTS